MAKAKTVKCRCKVCGAGFQALRRDAELCHAHAHKAPPEYINDVGGTSWVPRAKIQLATRVEQWLYAHSADNECVHGALPHDKKLPEGCLCWGERVEFEEKQPEPAKKRERSSKAA